MTADRRRLDWLEVGRGLAAFGVVLTHYDPWWLAGTRAPAWFNLRVLGEGSVEFFFILSGFIIYSVHGHELSRPGTLPDYAWRRFVRLFPTYWLILAFAVVFNQTFQNPAYRVDLTLPLFLKEVVLWPGAEPLIGPAWTLRHELLFYGVFGLALFRWWLGVPLFLCWMTAATANLLLNGLPPGMVYSPLGIVGHHYNINFMLGILIAVAAARDRMRIALAVALGAVLILLLMVLGSGGSPAIVALMWKAVFATVVSIAVVASRRGLAAPRIGVTLGAMSYVLYMSHISVGVVFRGGLKRVCDWNGVAPVPRLLTEVAVALLAAWLLHRWFEVPVLRRLRSRRRGATRPEIAAEA